MTRPCGSSRGITSGLSPYVYDLRPRRITAVGVHATIPPVQAIQLMLWALELARAVWRMPCYRRAALLPVWGMPCPCTCLIICKITRPNRANGRDAAIRRHNSRGPGNSTFHRI